MVLSVGVRPESGLAKAAGLKLGARGAIEVGPDMRTSDPDIYAVGDAVEITDFVTGQKGFVPLAGPANKQGRIAADNICGLGSVYTGTQGSAILKCFDMTVAATGLNERAAKEAGLENLSRRIVQKVDLMVIVADPSKRGMETMSRLHALAGEMGVTYGRLAMVINRLRRDEMPEAVSELQRAIGASYVVGLPDNEQLASCDEAGASLGGLGAENEVVKRIDRLLDEAGVIAAA
jgi:NAD(P)H-nitrite reductase large subunit